MTPEAQRTDRAPTPPAPLTQLRAVFAVFQEAQVPWCLLSGGEETDGAVGPVRALTPPASLPRVHHLLRGLEFLRAPAGEDGLGLCYVAYDQPADRWIQLQITTRLTFGPGAALRLPAEAACLGRSHRHGLLVLPAPDDAFWIALLDAIVTAGRVTAADASRLRLLAASARADGPLGQALDALCPPGWNAARMIEAARGENWPELEALGPRLHAPAARRQEGRARGAPWARRVRRPATGRPPRGLSVALLGPDGAGKSTLAAGIARGFYFPARRVYMGLWQGAPRPQRAARVPGSDLGALVLRAWRPYLIGRYHQARGRLVIFDRYTYDALMAAPARPDWRSRAYYWLLGHACPAPDLTIVLDVPGSVMYARKGEHSPEQLESQRRRFLALSTRLPHATVLDAAGLEDAVRREAVARIWRRYVAERGRKRL
jgi:thymidylate kinase